MDRIIDTDEERGEIERGRGRGGEDRKGEMLGGNDNDVMDDGPSQSC